jgi:phospholipase C
MVVMKYVAAVFAFALVAVLVACAGQSQPSALLPQGNPAGGRTARGDAASPSPIRHVVIIFQENRTPDDLFQGLPGADIATTAVDSEGEIVPLKPISLAVAYDLGHGHKSFLNDCDLQPNGTCKMDGFDLGMAPKYHLRPFGYAPASEVQPYLDMAKQYVFADRMFQSNQAGSFPAHQYIVSGTASALPVTPFNVSSDPYNSKNLRKVAAGCDAPALAVVDTIDPNDGSAGPTAFPCFERPVLSDFLDRRGITWRYYQKGLGPGLWHALDAIQHVRYGPDYANVVTPPESILSDISTGNLPGVSWVNPADGKHSDHSGSKSAAGPSWVAAVVNAVGESQYWDSTAIFVTWDDWGGWYDHVPPPQMNNFYELGCRVPLIVISPYAKRGYVSHSQHEFGSILAFVEKTFGIRKGALGATDVRSDNLMDAFYFKRKKPRAFVPIAAPTFAPGSGPSSELDAEDP